MKRLKDDVKKALELLEDVKKLIDIKRELEAMSYAYGDKDLRDLALSVEDALVGLLDRVLKEMEGGENGGS